MVLFVLHTFLLYVNRTTLEHFRLNTGAKYDLGCLENFAQVMGSSVSVWCVPCIWGVDNQLYNGGEWEPGKVIVVPSDSPEVRNGHSAVPIIGPFTEPHFPPRCRLCREGIRLEGEGQEILKKRLKIAILTVYPLRFCLLLWGLRALAPPTIGKESP
jgi:hypothetical protein